MVIVWQYGSNMHEERLKKRLNGSAEFIGLAIKRGWKLVFSHTNLHGVGVSDIIESDPHDYVIGCLYEIPKSKMMILDRIEGVESGAYKKLDDFLVTKLDSTLNETFEEIRVTTYLVADKEKNPRTDSKYANHILEGIREHTIGLDYFTKVKEVILENNPNIRGDLVCYFHC